MNLTDTTETHQDVKATKATTPSFGKLGDLRCWVKERGNEGECQAIIGQLAVRAAADAQGPASWGGREYNMSERLFDLITRRVC